MQTIPVNNPSVLPPRNSADLGKWISELAKAGATLGYCGRMCSDCAFKYAQIDQQDQDYINAVQDAVFQLAWDGRFHCHTADKKDAGISCAGFEYAKQYLRYRMENSEDKK